MSLPAAFTTPHEYFRAAIDFLQRHSWIYQHANTRFIRAGVLDRFPADFAEYFLNVSPCDLNAFPFLHEDTDVNSRIKSATLRSFRSELQQLVPQPSFILPTLSANKSLFKMSPKKQHEVVQLAHCINAHCQRMGLLLDFGAGLGYLSTLLHSLNSQWRILGLEANEKRVATAQKLQQLQVPQAAGVVAYRQHFIDTDGEALKRQARASGLWPSTEPARDWAIIGLHACADLSVTAIKLFLDMPAVQRLVIMPCCYHKLALAGNTGTGGMFCNFPLSAALKTALTGVERSSELFNRPFLRLACQETNERWREFNAEQHESHARQMYWRALADAIVSDESEMPVALMRSHAVDPHDSEETFENMRRRFALREKNSDGRRKQSPALPWKAEHEVKFNEIVARYAGAGPQLAKGLTCLQMTIQKLCENILLYDWLCYMEECAASRHDFKINARFQKILNEKLSPRCYALIAEKL